MAEQFQLRHVILNRKKYILADDIVALIREAAATQESDARDYLEKLAEHLKGGFIDEDPWDLD